MPVGARGLRGTGSAALGAHCACPPSLYGTEIARKALGSGVDSLETLVIIMLTVKNESVNP